MAISAPGLQQYEALPGRVLFGTGALAELPAELDRLECRRVLLIDGLLHPATGTAIVSALAARLVHTLSVSRQHVPQEMAEEALALTVRDRIDCLLSVGGGSSLGVAKAVGRDTDLPIIAVPTTYAGSEMTPIWGVTSEGHKTTGRALSVLPKVVIYEPGLTTSLPPAASGASGMNAVAHCVEALWTERRNPVTDAVATEGLVQLASGLRRSVAAPEDLSAREQALRGAWLAGMALAVGGTGLHHKICHVLGGAFNLPHAETHAAVLPWVVEHYRLVVPDVMARVAGALGEPEAAAGLQRLALDVGAVAGLADLGLDGSGADSAAATVAASAPDYPAPVTAAEIRTILQHSMSGPRPSLSTHQHQREHRNG